ncbi:MAG TPA: ferric reductase-like transmembrane domain-containing protein [Candidatus Thermoplasmatota archaeon]|nr:ferric reductase-like transmembrane domain-containing protein [Candidatus Thermoplasmatota archaeon]
MVSGRLLGILTVALLALGALAASGQQGGAHYVGVRDSSCWSCHASWTPPLKRSANLVPGDPVAGAVGSTIPYTVQVQNAWRTEIRAYVLTIDLRNAPSLNFASGQAPIKDEVRQLVIPAANDPASLGSARQADTRINITVPASSSSLVIAPQDTNPTTGPSLVGYMVGPDGNETTYPSTGPGKPIPVADPFTGRSGSFRVGARVLPPNPSSPSPTLPSVSQVPFTVTYSAEFNLEGLREVPISWQSPQPLPFPDKAVGKIQLVRGLNFTVAKAAGDGESIRFWFNSTVHYTHVASPDPRAPGGGDWANWTQEPLEVPVKLDGEKVRLEPTSTVVERPTLINGPTLTTTSEVLGYAASFLIVSSIASGGMFGKASRRGMNNLFGSAKRRVAFHNFLSYGIILVALVHMVLFLIPGDFVWTRGLIWGGLSILAMLGLGVTGAMQVPMIRRWNYGTWRWTHYGMTVAVILFTILHMLLEGVHFGDVQEALNYSDPFNPVPTTA